MPALYQIISQPHVEAARKDCGWFLNTVDGNSTPYNSYINHFITLFCAKTETVTEQMPFLCAPWGEHVGWCIPEMATLKQHGCKG